MNFFIPHSAFRIPHFLSFLLPLLPVVAWAGASRRVVSLSPNLTESVCAIGAGDLLVGVGDFCQYPPAVRALRRCGTQSSPAFEALSVLRPDLILVLGQAQKVRDFAGRHAIAVEGFTMDNAASIRGGLTRLGRLLGREEGATSFTRVMDRELAELKAGLDSRPAAQRPAVLLSLGRQAGALAEIMVPGGGSFLDEALTLAGGRNVFGDVREFYPHVSKESLLVRRPEAILELTGGVEMTEAQQQRMIQDWNALASLPAVRRGRIRVLTQDYLMMPGPRLPQIVRTLRDALDPGDEK